jgi:hypothetical protein
MDSKSAGIPLNLLTNIQSLAAGPFTGRVMAQAVSRRPLTEEAQVRSPVSPCGICDGRIGSGTGFSATISVFSCQFHTIGAPLHGTTKKLIIFITGLHNMSQGCGASVPSAAGPFTTKRGGGLAHHTDSSCHVSRVHQTENLYIILKPVEELLRSKYVVLRIIYYY